ncbi:hypothetical protein BD560DRAFT_393980 [Blakeslea trispora]|nr:hypothetical protein BD560DRAFT_393980 [Blakeslea trispora]
MPITNELSLIFEYCRQTSNNIIELRNELSSIKEDVVALKEAATGLSNTRQNSNNASLSNQSSVSNEQGHSSIAKRPIIPYPLPAQLGSTKSIFESRVDYFLQSWLQNAAIVHSDYQEENINLLKSMIYTFASFAVEAMIYELEMAKIDWCNLSFRHIDAQYITASRGFLRSLFKAKNIPSEHCPNFWLEKELLKHYYHSKRQTKKKKIMREAASATDPVDSNHSCLHIGSPVCKQEAPPTPPPICKQEALPSPPLKKKKVKYL